MKQIRNIAIIAHVDHGKTTLIDTMLQQSGTFHENKLVSERAMDKGDLEKERGITIMAKCTSIKWKDTRINVIDTPGHADFGGEVERVLSMVDGVLLLVDAAEGPKPQTKFVLGKALKLGLKPIVVINKIDRSDARQDEVIDEIFDLFINLDATEEQLDFPIIYASGRSGWAINNLQDARENINPIFETIIYHVTPPKEKQEGEFSMIVVMREHDSYLGRILIGKIASGTAKTNMQLKVLNLSGELLETGRITKLYQFQGLEKIQTDEAIAGDIVAIAGLSKATVSDTIGSNEIQSPLQAQAIDPPTLSMSFSVNDSPLAGKEGTKLTGRLLQERLEKEAEENIAIQVTPTSDVGVEVAGRGELQLGILIETMRREGFEISISRPKVLFKTDENGKRLEPMEEVQIDVDEEFSGTIMESMSKRKAQVTDIRPSGSGKTRIMFIAPSRGLIGYHSTFLTETRGSGVLSHVFHSYGPYCGNIEGRTNGVLISTDQGNAASYALGNLEDRGILFIQPNISVYKGMIIGEHNRTNDLEVNPLKAKQLTNIRTTSKDKAIVLSPPKMMSLEDAISYIQDDERVEVTPKSIRLRKSILCPTERKRAGK